MRVNERPAMSRKAAVLEEVSDKVLAELKARGGPTFTRNLVRMLPITDVPLAASDASVPAADRWNALGVRVAAFLEARGDIYKVDAAHTGVREQFRSEPFAWMASGLTHKGETLPAYEEPLSAPPGDTEVEE